MADIFVSYTEKDREWAFWIGQELLVLGHTPRIHEWELSGGANIMAWMEERHHQADHVLCIISQTYLSKPYSSLERQNAQWAAVTDRPNFALPVFIEPCQAPTLFASAKRCELYGIADEQEARARLKQFLTPASRPAAPTRFPGSRVEAERKTTAFPGGKQATSPAALSNIPILVPRHFLGRDDSLAAIKEALERYEGRVAITALHGLRGVGKTTLAAAYAERHCGNYRATWWIRAQTEPGMRADLVALGVRLGWVEPDEKEEPALATVMEQLRQDGHDILLIYDNANNAVSLRPYLPHGGRVQVLVTSNDHVWRGVAVPIAIRLWPTAIGADYLIARTGRSAERDAALALSEALDGLPLAHEQAAAYCERLEISLAEYHKRFENAPARFLDDARHAPIDHNDGLTAAKSFALAIEQAAKLHPAAEPFIVQAALLAPEPIPLFLFSEAREKFGEPLASALAEDGLVEIVAALRAFALVERDAIADERDPSLRTDCIRLHRLIREVAAARREGEAREQAHRTLVEAVAAVYPDAVWRDPQTWPRARRLDPLALALVRREALPRLPEARAADLLIYAGQYRVSALAAYAPARRLFEQALAIREKALGPEHPDTATSLNELARLLQDTGELEAALPLFRRALAIREKALGAEHADVATSLNNLGVVLQQQGDFKGSRPFKERALAIRQKLLGPEHTRTATSLVSLGLLLHAQSDLAAARPLFERALAIREKVLGPEHPDTAMSLISLAGLLHAIGDSAGARPLFDRALAICEKQLGPEHPSTATSLHELGRLLLDQGDLAAARPLCERAVAICEKMLGPGHSYTATCINDLARLLQRQGDLAAARPLFQQALAILTRALGDRHPQTNQVRGNFARLFVELGDAGEALRFGMAALDVQDKALGTNHPWTRDCADVAADALDALGSKDQSAALRARYGIAGERGERNNTVASLRS